MDDQKLLDSIKELNLIEEKKLKALFEESQKGKMGLEALLLERDVISEENLAKVKAYVLNLPFFSAKHTSVNREALEVIPEIVAKKQKIVAFGRDEKGLKVAMAHPENTEIIEFLKKKTGLDIEIFYTTEDEILDALALYSIDTKKVFDEIISRSAGLSEPPIQELVNKIIEHAYKNRSSDIHIEPLNEKSLVRFRIDGIMHDIIELPKELHPQVITRIKVMANLQTDEHLAPQDGKITLDTDMDNLDLRVSIVPITEGEKVVMRLLSERSRQFSLQDLGFGEKDFAKVEDAYKQPHGMILVTGPTGSGKTTTLYAIIKLLNRREVNITTIEDPVEYSLEGINQIQTNEITGLTFAKGLRSLVRQDPDIILVGEIRDEETANIAINSAMTGHLVLSSLHTNDAATAIPRFMDLNIEPFLIASTVNIIVAQRLVRKICTNCKASKTVEIDQIHEEFRQYFPDKKEIRLYHGEGCEMCHGSGYQGRLGIFEVLVMNDAIREAITKKEDSDIIQKEAIESGMVTMLEDGVEKVKNGITTLEEVIRVTKT